MHAARSSVPAPLPQGRVGVVGLGRMGAGIAGNLAAQGVEVLGYDLEPGKGRGQSLRVTNDPRELAAECPVLIFSLPRAEHLWPALEAIAGKAVTDLLPGTTVIDMGTSIPQVQRRVAAELATRKVAFLDAPVSGGPNGAHAGTLLIMVGGDAFAFERMRPLLELAGRKVTHLGPVGAGTTAKLLNNGIVAATVLAVNEAVSLAERHDIAPGTLLQALNAGSARSYITEEITAPHVAGAVIDVRFSLDQLLKDAEYLGISIQGESMPESIFDAAITALRKLVESGFGGNDFGDIRPWKSMQRAES